jgi:hypothetical protein
MLCVLRLWRRLARRRCVCHAPGGRRLLQWAASLNKSLEATDPALFDIIEKEKQRQRTNLVLIASEVRAAVHCAWRSGDVRQRRLAVGVGVSRLAACNRARGASHSTMWLL